MIPFTALSSSNTMRAYLKYWRSDEKVFHISGINFLHGKSASGDSSYYFHRHPAILGWATWERTWSNCDLRLPDWAWDSHWTYATWGKSGLTTYPRQNLVTNLRFGKDVTHRQW